MVRSSSQFITNRRALNEEVGRVGGNAHSCGELEAASYVQEGFGGFGAYHCRDCASTLRVEGKVSMLLC